MALLGFVVWGISWFVPVHEALDAGRLVERAAEDLTRGLREAAEKAGAREGGEDTPDAVRRSARAGGGDLDLGPYSGPPGWRAFRASWDMLTGRDQRETDDSWVKVKILGLTGLTNVVMLAAIVLFLGTGGRRRANGIALLVCAALDLAWIYLNRGDFVRGLEIGYYLWVAGFALAGFGLLARRNAVS
jgi:hypothetical protein